MADGEPRDPTKTATLAAALLRLAEDPDLLRELESAAKGDRAQILRGRDDFADLLDAAEALFGRPDSLRQIRVEVEAEFAASETRRLRITYVIITF